MGVIESVTGEQNVKLFLQVVITQEMSSFLIFKAHMKIFRFYAFSFLSGSWLIYCRWRCNATGDDHHCLLWHNAWACTPAVQVRVNTDPVFLSPHNVTKHRTQHGPLGNRRISHAPKPISSDLKLGRAIAHVLTFKI